MGHCFPHLPRNPFQKNCFNPYIISGNLWKYLHKMTAFPRYSLNSLPRFCPAKFPPSNDPFLGDFSRRLFLKLNRFDIENSKMTPCLKGDMCILCIHSLNFGFLLTELIFSIREILGDVGFTTHPGCRSQIGLLHLG